MGSPVGVERHAPHPNVLRAERRREETVGAALRILETEHLVPRAELPISSSMPAAGLRAAGFVVVELSKRGSGTHGGARLKHYDLFTEPPGVYVAADFNQKSVDRMAMMLLPPFTEQRKRVMMLKMSGLTRGQAHYVLDRAEELHNPDGARGIKPEFRAFADRLAKLVANGRQGDRVSHVDPLLRGPLSVDFRPLEIREIDQISR